MTDGEKTIKINDELTLIQKVNGLTFGTDAYLLSAFAKGGAKQICADLGSGTGVIPLLMAQSDKYKKIFAVEIQKDFASLIKRNAKQNSLEDRIIPLSADVREIKATDVGGEIDAVTANPPYMKVDSGKRNEYDEKFIARHEVCGDINDFCACAYRLLKHGGKFYTVWRPDRLCDLVFSLRSNRLEPKLMTFVCATTESEPSMVLVQSTKGAASGAKITRPLILHKSLEDAKRAILSPDAERIYAACSFEDFK
ncbi:MAG: methyltransferase [Clostridia bacterium]|nr:methyltransferase [Clostridia bacterium]